MPEAAIGLALLSALSYGASDFLAGLMSRRASVLVVLTIGQVAAVVVTLLALPWTSSPPSGASSLWGVAAGAGAFVGTLFLYRGLARGWMSIVAPVSAVSTAVGAVAVGVALGDRPGALALIGIALACLATGLVSASSPRDDPSSPRRSSRGALFDGIAAGVGFALLFVALHRAGNGAGLWPVAMSQMTALALVVVFAAARRVEFRTVRITWRGAVPAGILGSAATITYFLATQIGLLTVTAVIASLYPAATVGLAIVVVGERPRRVQAVGLMLAAAAVAMLALS